MLALYLTIPFSILLFSSRASVGGRFSPEYYLLSLALIQNWGFTRELDWNVPSWSISTEWLAYILFPLMVAVMGQIRRPLLLGVLLPSLLLAIAVVFASAGGLASAPPRYGAVRCVLEFWTGVCLFQVAPADPSRRARAGAALAFVILCAAHGVLGSPDYLVMPAAFLCLVFALSRDDGIASGVLANPVLRWLGTISYSTYLVHFFLREWVKLTLVRDGIPPMVAFLTYLTATLCASVLLYRWVEVPGRTALRGWLPARWITASRAVPTGRGRTAAAGSPAR